MTVRRIFNLFSTASLRLFSDDPRLRSPPLRTYVRTRLPSRNGYRGHRKFTLVEHVGTYVRSSPTHEAATVVRHCAFPLAAKL